MNLDNRAHTTARRSDAFRPVAFAIALAAAAVAARPAVAHAQEVVVVNQGREGGSTYRGPNWMLLSSGLIVFGGTYTASIVVASTSGHAGDQGLYAPLVGPWLDIANRCPIRCDDETGRKVLLGFDGVFQAIGALSIVGSFVFPYGGRGGVAQNDGPSFRVLPASLGRGAPGLVALGTF
jgi:hypothetical protein